MAIETTLLQTDRWLALDTPLGRDELVATGVKGSEGISRLFDFKINAVSSKQVIEPKSLLGQSVTLSMARPGGKRRFVNGIVSSMSAGAVNRSGFRVYTLTVSPKLWVLDRVSDYKVFQSKSAVAIVEEVLRARGIDFRKNLRRTYLEREYCVQFGETDLAFVERLLGECGIFYYFTHSDGAHQMVLADNASSYPDAGQAEVNYRQDQQDASDAIFLMDVGATLTDAEWVFEEYDFETPSQKHKANNKARQEPSSKKDWQHYRYRAGGTNEETVDLLAAAAIDGVDGGFETTHGQSTCATFTPGHVFKLNEHLVADLAGKSFVLSEVTHEALDRTHFTNFAGAEGRPFYRNSFVCSPSSRVVGPPLAREKPIALGPQTAIVVGPSGEEIHTDKYGRIRVQFHWDRVGTKDENSSCFVRVAQSWAGRQFGTMFIPRIGMEVVVQFVDGDPDKPIVTGAVYNAENMPPWGLTDNMTKSGLLTRSSKQGGEANANELSFEDKKGEEKILFHAEKDFVREVENDDTLDVGNNQVRTIKKDRTTTLSEGSDSLTIKQGDRTETIEAGKRTTIVKGNDDLTVKAGNHVVGVKSGNDELTVSSGNRKVEVTGGNDSLTVNGGDHVTKAGGGKITLDAGLGVILKCGTNTIEVSPQGISINGVAVTVQGTAKTEIKGPMVTVSGDGMTVIKGGIVKIN